MSKTTKRQEPKSVRRRFVGGSWSDSGEEDDEKVKDETCLVAHASSEVCSKSSYFSDENSSIDDIALDNEYDKLCKMIDLEPNEWIKDSGCSKHMTGNRKLFSTYKAYNGGNVIIGSNLRGNIIGKGQIRDNKCRVTYSEHDSEITKEDKVIGRGIGKKGLYVMKLGNKPKDKKFLTTIDENSTLWHRRLGHANMRLIQSLASKELVRNLPNLKFDQHFYDACKIRKQAHASHKAKNVVSMTRCLELLHMDLFGPCTVRSYGGNCYTLVIVDDYYRYTWTRFLKDKTEAFDQFEIFCRKIQNELGCSIVSIRTDHGRELDNEVQFGEFCNTNSITHNFSALRIPQSNGVVERKNRTLQEMSRTMLNEQSLPQKFWCNTVDTSTYILNRILIRAILGKTPYELLRGRKPTIDYFRVFGSKCFILNIKDYLSKFDPKSYEGFFLGYSKNSKAYIILNKHTRKVKESLNVTFDETSPPSKTSPLVDDDLDEEEAIKVTERKNLENDIMDETLEVDEIINIKESRNRPLGNVIGNLNQRTLRSQAQNQSNFFCCISTIEPKNVNEALGDESWIVAMQEELNQFVANDVWELVPQPRNVTIIGTKHVVMNCKIMHDEFEMSMMGELNFFLGLQIKQMEDGIFFNQSKYIKEMLKKFGLEESKPMKTPMSSDTKLTKDEECESVDSTKYQGMIGSLLYLTASRPDIMFSVCLCARFQEAPKTSHLEAVKRIFRYIKGTTHLGLWYPKGTGIETVVYADSDHAGDYVDRKSTSGICTFVGCCLTSWFSKKQTALAISTTEAEYVSAGKACQQALWMKQALIDYDVRLDDVPIMCDNKGAIDLSKNPVQHSRTKHIEIRHHFLRDNVQKGHISIEKVPSVDNIADILTKPLKRESFNYLHLGACVFTDRWRLDELAYGIPSDGPYQTNLPSIEDIISSIRIDRGGQVRCIRHEEEIDVLEYQVLTHEIEPTLKPLEEIIREIENPELQNESYVLYDRVMTPLAAQLEQKPRRDRGTRRGRHSTSSSSAFGKPSSSHRNDDDDDGNDEGTSRVSIPSPIRYVNSLTNQVPQVFQNPPNIDPHLEPFYTRQTKIINRQVQLRDEHRSGVKSIGKSLRRLWRNIKK
ncbi:retrovirus-related pol polyprotein from transposon TNT 1-94 [Tanacetum coccineum]|uniref:Retrovirus-related pol polyprotein from transposon TNT 1-94 n=1 Tax=Tanacetum coccineum TaxID=301880 RepID=A0ABQ4ZBV0_9ASTR